MPPSRGVLASIWYLSSCLFLQTRAVMPSVSRASRFSCWVSPPKVIRECIEADEARFNEECERGIALREWTGPRPR